MSTVQEKQFEEELLAKIIPQDHAYRKLNRLINFEKIAQSLEKTYSHLVQHGIPAVRGLKALLLQFWEDYSDREMEAAVRENIAIRWFCGFSLTERTPDHSYFGSFVKESEHSTSRISLTQLMNNCGVKACSGIFFTSLTPQLLLRKPRCGKSGIKQLRTAMTN